MPAKNPGAPIPLRSTFQKITVCRGAMLRRLLLPVFMVFIMLILLSGGSVLAQDTSRVIRVARIVIDPQKLGAYTAELQEEMETAVRIEPGVLTLYAVQEKDNPAHITVFEIYASAAAYKAHLDTPHFKKYKAATKDMVKSLELKDVKPIALVAKPRI